MTADRAQIADLRAKVARVEALADEWQASHEETWFSVCGDQLRAALDVPSGEGGRLVSVWERLRKIATAAQNPQWTADELAFARVVSPECVLRLIDEIDALRARLDERTTPTVRRVPMKRSPIDGRFIPRGGEEEP